MNDYDSRMMKALVREAGPYLLLCLAFLAVLVASLLLWLLPEAVFSVGGFLIALYAGREHMKGWRYEDA